MRTTALILAATLSACGTQIGSEDGYGCLTDTTETVTDLGAVPDGFTLSAQDALDLTTGTWTGTITRPDDSTQAVEVTVTATGDLSLERRSWQDDGDGSEEDLIEPAIGDGLEDCPDVFTFGATLAVVSGGDLDESGPATVTVSAGGQGSASMRIAFDDVVGDAVPTLFDPAEMSEVELTVDMRTETGGWRGDVGFFGEDRSQASGPDGVVSATNDTWGTFVLGDVEPDI